MKLSLLILLISLNSFSQDSVRAKIKWTAENTIVYKVEGRTFASFCKCDSATLKKFGIDTLKRGVTFMIPRKRFDSLLLEAKPIRRKDL